MPAGAPSRRRHSHRGGKSGKSSGSCIQKGPCPRSDHGRGSVHKGRCEPCFGLGRPRSLCHAAAPGVLWEMGWRQCWLFIVRHQEGNTGEKGCTKLQLIRAEPQMHPSPQPTHSHPCPASVPLLQPQILVAPLPPPCSCPCPGQ